MDHLPRVSKPIFMLPEIPVTRDVGNVYDGGGLKDYPERRPSQISDQLQKTDYLTKWIYFGVIIELLSVWSVPFNLDDFIVEGTETPWRLSSKLLPDYLLICVLHEYRLNPHVLKENHSCFFLTGKFGCKKCNAYRASVDERQSKVFDIYNG